MTGGEDGGQGAGECSSALEKKNKTVADHCAHVAVRTVATQNRMICARDVQWQERSK